jgi:UDP-glucuronate 4-epimerase
MTTTLITGGAGFIGSMLADALLARGEQVICIDNFDPYYSPAHKRANVQEALKKPNYRLIEGDIRDTACIEQIFTENKIDRVAHLAALAGVRNSIKQAALYADVNVKGTINLLDAARDHEVSNFVLASTSSVYGETDQIPFQEEQASDKPLAPYPATKKACEVMAHAYVNMFGMNINVLRFFTVYGPRCRPDMMAYRVIESILNDQEITLFNPDQMKRDWTYVDDIISGVAAALDIPLGYEIFNIGRGEPVHLYDFVTIIQELVGKEAIVKKVEAPASEPQVTYASIDKARRLLGYQPHTSIRDGLARTWDWYQQRKLQQEK